MELDNNTIHTLLHSTESERVERKASLADKDRICEAICAFTNDLPDNKQPGIIFTRGV